MIESFPNRIALSAQCGLGHRLLKLARVCVLWPPLPLTTQFTVANMWAETKKVVQCGQLVERSDRRGVTSTFAAFQLSSLVDCHNSLTIDVDDADSIEPSLLAQPHSPGRVLQSPHAAKPVCAHSPSLSTGAARCRVHAPRKPNSVSQTQSLRPTGEQQVVSTTCCGMTSDSTPTAYASFTKRFSRLGMNSSAATEAASMRVLHRGPP